MNRYEYRFPSHVKNFFPLFIMKYGTFKLVAVIAIIYFLVQNATIMTRAIGINAHFQQNHIFSNKHDEKYTHSTEL